jgi:hypothetical protein
MGGGGFYYSQTLPNNEASHRFEATEQAPQESTHGPMKSIGSAPVAGMVDTSSSELLREINAKRKRITWWPPAAIMTLVGSIACLASGITLWLVVPLALLCVAGVVFSYQYDQLNKSVVLMYELEGPSLQSYERLFHAVQNLGRCSASWHITANADVYNPKYHAGAGRLIDRRRLYVGARNPPFVRTNLTIPALAFSQHTLFFLPDRILVFTAHEVGAVDYDDLQLESQPTRFIEGGAVPRDAKVVDHTWQFVNKDGGPDRRFNNNRQIPICQYEELRLTSSRGINEIVQLSRTGISHSLQAAVAEVVSNIRDVMDAESARQDTLRKATVARSSPPGPPIVRAEAVPNGRETALCEILCAAVVSDGRLTQKERQVVRSVMSRFGPYWTTDECDRRLDGFIHDVRARGQKVVMQSTLERAREFQQNGYAKFLLESLETALTADGVYAERERAFYDEICKILGVHH